VEILRQGELRHRYDAALNFALGLNLLGSFTIGAESQSKQEDLSAASRPRDWAAVLSVASIPSL